MKIFFGTFVLFSAMLLSCGKASEATSSPTIQKVKVCKALNASKECEKNEVPLTGPLTSFAASAEVTALKKGDKVTLAFFYVDAAGEQEIDAAHTEIASDGTQTVYGGLNAAEETAFPAGTYKLTISVTGSTTLSSTTVFEIK